MLRSTLILLVVGSVHSVWEDKIWENFKIINRKSYGAAEEAFRRKTFLKNLDTIDKHNRQYQLGLKTYSMALNKFADMTEDEFNMYKGLRYNASRPLRSGLRSKSLCIRTVDLPMSIDWRRLGVVSPVKNQGTCGSCWAFSAVGSLEGQYAKSCGKLVQFSEKNLVDCDNGNGGCNGGMMDRAFDYIKKNGINTEDSYPYRPSQDECHFDPHNIGTRIRHYLYVDPGSEEDLQKVVASVGPVSVTIDARHKFRFYDHGIYNEPKCSSTKFDHAVLVVGYGTENGEEYWLVKNSWGADWGKKGYAKMSRNKNNQCGIATHAVYPVI